jgi:mannitol 2-dehydrogenase
MLLGMEYAHQTMEDAGIRKLVERMMDREVTPVLPEVPGVDLALYKRTLIERFANPAIRDQLSRIGIYGSAGMPKFVLPSIQEQLQRGGPIGLLSFTIACWFRYLNGRDDQGREIVMKDPMAPRLRQVARAAGTDPGPLFAMREIFSQELAESPRFVDQVKATLQSFHERGARAALTQALAAV